MRSRRRCSLVSVASSALPKRPRIRSLKVLLAPRQERGLVLQATIAAAYAVMAAVVAVSGVTQERSVVVVVVVAFVKAPSPSLLVINLVTILVAVDPAVRQLARQRLQADHQQHQVGQEGFPVSLIMPGAVARPLQAAELPGARAAVQQTRMVTLALAVYPAAMAATAMALAVGLVVPGPVEALLMLATRRAAVAVVATHQARLEMAALLRSSSIGTRCKR